MPTLLKFGWSFTEQKPASLASNPSLNLGTQKFHPIYLSDNHLTVTHDDAPADPQDMASPSRSIIDQR